MIMLHHAKTACMDGPPWKQDVDITGSADCVRNPEPFLLDYYYIITILLLFVLEDNSIYNLCSRNKHVFFFLSNLSLWCWFLCSSHRKMELGV